MRKILLIEDHQGFARGMQRLFKKNGYEVRWEKSGRSGIKAVEEEQFLVCLLDLKLPDMNGNEVLKKMVSIDVQLPVIIITAYGTIENAVDAMKSGAYDFMTKPIDPEYLMIIMKRIADEKRREIEHQILKDELEKGYEIVGRSEVLKKALDLVDKVAKTNATVLILGESGTGKELIARAIHRLSPRRQYPFVPINCAAIPHELLENELFGSERGAYTGSVSRKIGKLESADLGTVFLDEVGDLDLSLQAKLLRVLEEKRFERLGGIKPIEVDVRFIAASNRDLKRLVAEKRFREDLYFRLSIFPIHLPPIRARKSDIPILVYHFLRRFGGDRKISEEAMEKLLGYDWPGNVRELENTVERAIILSSGEIKPEHILIPNVPEEVETPSFKDLKEARRWAERMVIEQVLRKTNGNRKEAARILKVSYRSLRQKIKEYNI